MRMAASPRLNSSKARPPPDSGLTHISRPPSFATAALDAEPVLVDRDHFPVGQDLSRRFVHAGDVVPGDQRRGHHCPQARNARDTRRSSSRRCRPRACPRRSNGPAPHAARAARCISTMVITPMRPVVRRVLPVEAVPDVAGGTPQIADVLCPQPRLGGAPFADATGRCRGRSPRSASAISA